MCLLLCILALAGVTVGATTTVQMASVKSRTADLLMRSSRLGNDFALTHKWYTAPEQTFLSQPERLQFFSALSRRPCPKLFDRDPHPSEVAISCTRNFGRCLGIRCLAD
jgi:hypothetical protein